MVLAQALVLGSTLPACHATPAVETAPVPASWAVVCAWLREQADTLARDLDRAREVLRERAADDPALLARLDGPAPSGRTPGYGVLPEVREDPPFATVAPRERRYALKPISENFVTSFRDARVLAERTAKAETVDLAQAVRDYERLRGDLDNLLDHLAYHEQWQPDAVEFEAFFAERNALVADVRAMTALQASMAAAEAGADTGADTDAQRLASLREAVRVGLSDMRRAEGLTLERTGDGAWVLPVLVYTDVTDAKFRDLFIEAVEQAWNGSDAARRHRFSLRVRLEVIAPDTLYPHGAPTAGAPVDLEDHLARFPEGSLVMTTGAASTHAWKGRWFLLGPSPITRRTLAHEFGHLLGFDDGYVRGFDGSPDGPFGVVFVEWTGLVDDLMGNPRGGRVTDEMVEQLIETYQGADPVAP